jgi:hypothetical protein
VGQVFQADQTVWVLFDDASTDMVVDFLFQPSLSSANNHQAPGGAASAFLLQPFSQSCIMIGFGADVLARITCCCSLRL